MISYRWEKLNSEARVYQWASNVIRKSRVKAELEVMAMFQFAQGGRLETCNIAVRGHRGWRQPLNDKG